MGCRSITCMINLSSLTKPCQYVHGARYGHKSLLTISSATLEENRFIVLRSNASHSPTIFFRVAKFYLKPAAQVRYDQFSILDVISFYPKASCAWCVWYDCMKAIFEWIISVSASSASMFFLNFIDETWWYMCSFAGHAKPLWSIMTHRFEGFGHQQPRL